MKGLNKIVGGFLGFLLAGPGGCLLGILIGHVFDKHLNVSTQSRSWREIWIDMLNKSGAYQKETNSDFIVASELKKAYRLLELSKGASQAEVKQAYRRAISRYHPDRLAKQNLSPYQLKKATKKLQQAKDSYEMILKAENFS